MSGQRVYWDHNGMLYLISDGGAPKVCTKTGPTSYSGAGAPEQLISQGVTYYDTIEKRSYTRTGGSWVLTLTPGRQRREEPSTGSRRLRRRHSKLSSLRR
jgi:hypothetical protein